MGSRSDLRVSFRSHTHYRRVSRNGSVNGPLVVFGTLLQPCSELTVASCYRQHRATRRTAGVNRVSGPRAVPGPGEVTARSEMSRLVTLGHRDMRYRSPRDVQSVTMSGSGSLQFGLETPEQTEAIELRHQRAARASSRYLLRSKDSCLRQ